MSYAIMTDTSANLPTPLLREKGIDAIPFSYHVNGEEGVCLDTEHFDDAAFYGRIRKGALVGTSQIPPQRYMDHFETALRTGRDLLYIAMSSGISGSCASAGMAARSLLERYPQRTIEVVDTLGASLGEGLHVLTALRLREEGVPLGEAARRLRADCVRTCQIFTVDDLMHLSRNGRLSSVGAMVGSMLGIKPLLKGNAEGRIVVCGKVRGRKRAIEELAARYERLVEQPEQQTVGIAQADCVQDAQYLISLLKRSRPPKEILSVKYEPVTGSHVGPGALALFFLGGGQVRELC